MTDKHNAVMDCVRFLEGEGYTVIYVALYGSQNYGMDTRIPTMTSRRL